MIALYIILGIIALLVILYIYYHNKFVVLKERVTKAWNDIDIQLKRRFDLIPNLLETVKGYASHEKEIFEKVAKLRTGYENAQGVKEKGQIANELSDVVKAINVSVEAYPELKANENFIQLQNELKNTEDKISYSRQFYNDITTRYNQAIKVMPGNIFASMLGYKEAEYFEAKSEERENVKVQF